MSVYVDQLFTWPIEHTAPAARALARRTGGRWCHLTADTVEELHAFAAKLGLKRAWFQDKEGRPHYDLTPGKRWQALRLGAIEGNAHHQVLRRIAQQFAMPVNLVEGDGTYNYSSARQDYETYCRRLGDCRSAQDKKET